MALRLKAFAIWLVLPYLFYEAVVPGILSLSNRAVTLAPQSRLRNLAIALATCASQAAFGTVIIWVLPIRRAWVGIISGVILAAAGVTLWAWLEVSSFGGFEENVDITVTAALFMLPSCLAGAYVGFLRSRDHQSART